MSANYGPFVANLLVAQTLVHWPPPDGDPFPHPHPLPLPPKEDSGDGDDDGRPENTALITSSLIEVIMATTGLTKAEAAAVLSAVATQLFANALRAVVEAGFHAPEYPKR